METADPIDMITTVGGALLLVIIGVIAWQGRDDIANAARWVFHRYVVVHRPRVRHTTVNRFAERERVVAPDILSSDDEKVTDEAADARPSVRPSASSAPSALHLAADKLQADKTRERIIDTLVLAGWDVEAIRKVIKGANDAIGGEVAAARQRLSQDVPPDALPPAEPPRTIVVRESGGPPREIPI